MKPKKLSGATPYLFIAPFFAAFTLFYLLPMLSSVGLSLFKWSGLDAIRFNGLSNFRYIINDGQFWKALNNTFIILITTTSTIIALALVIAYILDSGAVGKLSRFFQTAYYFPNLVPAVACGLLFSFVFDRQTGMVNYALKSLGLIDKPVYFLGLARYIKPILGVVLSWRHMGYVMILLLTGLKTIPAELYEAARVDGACLSRQFIHITIPMLRRILSFIIITSSIGTFQLFDEPTMLLGGGYYGGPDGAGLTVMMYLFGNSFRDMSLGIGAATGVMIFVVILALTSVYLKLLKGDDLA